MTNKFWKFLAKQLARPAIATAILSRAVGAPCAEVYNLDGTVRMTAWWFLKERAWFPYAIRLHRIHTDDSSQGYHSHLCDYRTVVLRGWYLEKIMGGGFVLLADGNTIRHCAKEEHYISRVGTPGAWTMFFYKPVRAVSLGFLTTDRRSELFKRQWSDYLATRGSQHGVDNG